ncbi:MAG: chromosome segregation protein SMC [Ilumatobacteraceae bacterium]
MFLKALTLKGFKSFADPTVLEMEPGVTVVVGPNGSGKSNVVDAIAWVLGAQAPSSVRSQKMEDVIFNGTKKRPALGRAEVMLTLDNSAGLLPLEFSEVTISRTLFRNGDSEYAINGVECRLLDVQELLSDAGVGRQQHVIISQGQIDAVLTARAEDRRAIIEEAAGVLKYRKRKEKAERRLEATEANLLRVQDLIREVRRQLRPLERQAEAARRHEEVMTELRALRLFLTGREIASHRARLTALATEKSEVESTDAAVRGRLATLDTEVLAAEAELSARGDSGLSDELVRVEQLRERARGLSALIAERRRGLERDQGQMMADDVVATVEADVAQARAELAEVERGLSIATGESTALGGEEAAFEREREEKGMFASVPSSQASGAAAEVRGELRTLRNAVEQSAGEIQRLQSRIEEIARRDAQSAREAEALQKDLADAENAVDVLRAEMNDLDRRRSSAEASIDAAQEELVSAERTHAQRAARVESLASVDATSRARSSSRALDGGAGILGALIDLVQIDSGWDAAVRAALGDAVGAVLVADPAAARSALSALRDSGTAGAVLALGVPRAAGRGVPAGATSLRPHVRPVDGAPAGVDALLDALLDGYGFAEDIDDAVSAASSGTGTVVTRSGDRLGGAAWRVGAADELGSKEVVDAARRDETEALAAVSRCRDTADAARRDLTNVRLQISDTEERLRRQSEAVEMAADALTSAVTDRRTGAAEHEAATRTIEEARARMNRDAARVTELEALLPSLEETEAAELAAVAAYNEARTAFESKAAHLGMRRTDLEVRLAGLRERDQFLRQRISDGESKLGADSEARVEAAHRRERLEHTIVAIGRLSALVEEHRAATENRLTELHAVRQRQSDEVRALAARLDQARRDRHAAEQELEVARERSRRIELEETEMRMRLEAAVEGVRRELEVEPETAEAAPMPEVPEGTNHAERARTLERDIRLMGPINPLALQEFTELQTRHQFLEEQLADVRNSRRELSQVITAIDQEIQSVFAAAFADVSTNFVEMCSLLCPGGTGRLTLTNPDDLLNTGIEIEATPPGKTFKKLSLLSGGERSLTAVAFLFSVFRSRPSPFYVMDEVEAALDDVNLHRFLGLVAEFRRDAQLIIVSHQKRTMEAADCLLGVSMAPGGSSKVVTERSGAVTG